MTATHDQAGGRDYAVGALPARQLRIFLDAVDRNLAGTTKHREHRAVLQEVDGIVAPFAGGDLAAIEAENAIELAPVESHAAHGGEGRGARGLAPLELARLGIAVAHAAPPPSIVIPAGRDDRAGRGRGQEVAGRCAAAAGNCDIIAFGSHGFVNGFIMLPNCGPARANLKWEEKDCCLRARSASERRISQPPSPRSSGRVGPNRRDARGGPTRLRLRGSSSYGSTPTTFRPACAGLFFLCPKAWGRRPTAMIRPIGLQPARRRGSSSAYPPCRSALGPRPRRFRRRPLPAAERSTNWPCRSSRRA